MMLNIKKLKMEILGIKMLRVKMLGMEILRIEIPGMKMLGMGMLRTLSSIFSGRFTKRGGAQVSTHTDNDRTRTTITKKSEQTHGGFAGPNKERD